MDAVDRKMGERLRLLHERYEAERDRILDAHIKKHHATKTP